MAMYRIKPDENAPDAEKPSYPPEEYWRERKPEYARDLDFAEIAELNQKAESQDGYGDAKPVKPFFSPWLKALLALFAIAAFFFWTWGNLLSGAVDFSFLKRSAELAKDQALADLRAAVVVVECSGSSGSGFNVSEDGLIVTNAHVVDGGGLVTVTFSEGDTRSYSTKNCFLFSEADLALVDISGSDLPAVALSSTYPAAEDSVIIIGNPLGYDWTISEATVNGTVLIDGLPVIYLSGPVHPGSSGSPVFNASSQVVGVIFASISGEENSGLAIPVNYLIEILSEYEEELS